MYNVTAVSLAQDVCLRWMSPTQDPLPADARGRDQSDNETAPGDEFSTLPVDSAILLVGAELSEDVNILQDYLDADHATHYIAYASVPRGHARLQLARRPGKVSLEALRNLIGPSHHAELLRLFVKHVHPYLPIVDLSMFENLEHMQDDEFPSTLLCYVYMVSAHLWSSSPGLTHISSPDSVRATNLAIAALQADFMAPTVHTIAAAVLDLLARPVKSVTTNILTIGKLVALAQSHGLHRDPTRWSKSPEPISVRKCLCWAVVIQDQWGSYAHGTPPNISSNRHDVPMIDPTDYVVAQPPMGINLVSPSFTHLSILTKILGELLKIVHDLNTVWTHIPKVLRKVECSLDDWEEMVCRHYDNNPARTPPTGQCSLWFSYLAVKLLVQRLYLRAAIFQTALPTVDKKKYRIIPLRNSALAIVDFLGSLSRQHFDEFWHSYSAHFLVTATIMLLRCTIETREEGALQLCKAKLTALRATLERATNEYGWDVADICLERCSKAIDRVANFAVTVNGNHINSSATTSAHPQTRDDNSQQQPTEHPDWLNQPHTTLDMDLPLDAFDYPWDNI
ncbi:hypothetical protein Q7P35_000287 [Cladosporium inversicolor]